MNEHRRSPRKAAYATIPVTNLMTGQIVGRIGNLSSDGMLLGGEHAIAEGALFQFGFELRDGQGRAQSINVGVQEMWAERGNIPGQFWTGFHFIDISTPDLEAIETWLGNMKD